VPGDEEEDGVDDLENEFNWDGNESQYGAESLHGHMTYGRGGDLNGVQQPFQLNPNVPLLTNGQMVPLNQSVADTLLNLNHRALVVPVAQCLVSGALADG
jgi:hypothetical protein